MLYCNFHLKISTLHPILRRPIIIFCTLSAFHIPRSTDYVPRLWYLPTPLAAVGSHRYLGSTTTTRHRRYLGFGASLGPARHRYLGSIGIGSSSGFCFSENGNNTIISAGDNSACQPSDAFHEGRNGEINAVQKKVVLEAQKQTENHLCYAVQNLEFVLDDAYRHGFFFRRSSDCIASGSNTVAAASEEKPFVVPFLQRERYCPFTRSFPFEEHLR